MLQLNKQIIKQQILIVDGKLAWLGHKNKAKGRFGRGMKV